MTDLSADVLVVTALQLERIAARSHLVDVTVADANGLFVDIGKFTTEFGSLKIAILETGAGNIDAAVLTSRAEELLRPRILVMLGVAGGIKDVAIGDVVASSKIYWIEGGKQVDVLRPRPDFAPVSPMLVQLARAIATRDAWRDRANRHGGGPWPSAGRPPQVFAAPIVVGEKVLASSDSDASILIRSSFGDAVAIDMEDFGTLRGGNSPERVRAIAIRGISDLLDAKEVADAGGSQPLAAANAAAFAFEMLANSDAAALPTSSAETGARVSTLAELGAELFPEGPSQHSLWRRAGGDESRLSSTGPGFARWWEAATLLDRGGGGDITLDSLLRQMAVDFPNNDALRRLRDEG